MIDRKQMLGENAGAFVQENLMYGYEQIMQDIEDPKNPNFVKLMWDFDQFFMEIKKTGKKINTIGIYFLNTSLHGGKHVLQVEAYDDRMFDDDEVAVTELDIDFILKYYENEIQDFKNYMEKHVIQLRYHEVMHFQNVFKEKYQRFTAEVISQYLPFFRLLRSFSEIEDNEKIKFFFGEYITVPDWTYDPLNEFTYEKELDYMTDSEDGLDSEDESGE